MLRSITLFYNLAFFVFLCYILDLFDFYVVPVLSSKSNLFVLPIAVFALGSSKPSEFADPTEPLRSSAFSSLFSLNASNLFLGFASYPGLKN